VGEGATSAVAEGVAMLDGVGEGKDGGLSVLHAVRRRQKARTNENGRSKGFFIMVILSR